MKVQELKNYIETNVFYEYVINQFHAETSDDTCVVMLGSSGTSSRTIANLSFEFLVRSKDPEVAESKAFEIHSHFNNKSNFTIGTTRIIMTQGQQTVPIYTGTDSSNRTIYSVNINVIVDN